MRKTQEKKNNINKKYRIIASVDLHGDFKAIDKIVINSKHSDLVVIAGDLSNFEQNLRRILSRLNKSHSPVLVIPGNHETEESMIKESRGLNNIINIHKGYYLLDNILFLGYGTGGFSRHDINFVRTTKFFDRIIKEVKPEKIVLVTHAPPFGCSVDLLGNQHVGNKDITVFIKKQKPDLVICGHLHENAGVHDFINETLIINPGKFLFLEL